MVIIWNMTVPENFVNTSDTPTNITCTNDSLIDILDFGLASKVKQSKSRDL